MAASDWIILELTDNAETASYHELETAIQSFFGPEVELFLPMYYEKLGSYTSSNTLFHGYAFVKDSDEVRMKALHLRENSRYFIGVLKTAGRIRTIDSYTIGSLRKKLKKSLKKSFPPGITVKILEGVFVNLVGKIISTDDDGRIANIKICCMSREIIAPVPTTCIEKI